MASLVDELINIQEEGAAGVLATVVEADNGAARAGEKILIRDGPAVQGSLGADGGVGSRRGARGPADARARRPRPPRRAAREDRQAPRLPCDRARRSHSL